MKTQEADQFYNSLHSRFAAGHDALADRLEKQVELFQDVYQLYTFVQSRALDAFVKLNDRFEYETLWRYPTATKLKDITRANSDSVAGHMSTFTKFNQLRTDLSREYNTYKAKVSEEPSETVRRIQLPENILTDFHFDGAFMIHMNPSDQECMNCFNARLDKIKLVVDGDNFDFNITHLGTEMQVKMENGFRSFETIKSLPESWSVTAGEAMPKFNNRSPFANFLVEMRSGNYGECDVLPTDNEKKECQYKMRKTLKSFEIEFVITYIPNYPDQHPTSCH